MGTVKKSCCKLNPHHKKDSGHAWFILVACMIMNFLCIGFLFGAIGVLTASYEASFEVDIDTASWVGSVLIAVLFFSGPIAAYIIGRIGVRKVAVVGVLLHIVGFAVSAFAKKLWHVIPSFAVFSGLACSCTHVCTIKILTVCFDKYQHMAFAASAIGSDMSAVAFPFITSSIFGVVQYRDGVLVLAAILCLAVPCSLFFIEPRYIQKTRAPHEESNITLKDLQSDSNDTSDTLRLSNKETSPENHVTQSSSDREFLEEIEEIQQSNTEEHETHTLKEHLKLLKTPVIIVFILNSLLWNMGGAVTSVLSYSFYLAKGYSFNSASFAMTMYGVGSLVGSLLIALITIRWTPNKLFLHFGCNLLMGVMTIILPFMAFTDTALTPCIAVIGFTYGAICANLGGIIEHLNGSNLLYLVYGYEMAAAGVGSLIGPVVGGYLEVTYGIGTGYYFAGASILSALVLFIFYGLFNRTVFKPLSIIIEGNSTNNNVEVTLDDIDGNLEPL